jgi:glutaredoxin
LLTAYTIPHDTGTKNLCETIAVFSLEERRAKIKVINWLRQRKLIPRLRRNWQEDIELTPMPTMRTRKQIQVILYSKPGCRLCDVMKKAMARADCADLYELQEINIESDAELFARYASDIPVLIIDGVEAFRHRLDSDSFRAHLTKRDQ